MDEKSSGFTIIELIIVIAIFGIIAAIAVPRLTGFGNMAEERVCDVNCKTVERMYNAFLLGNEHLESRFNRFIIANFDEICPASGVISYENGKAKCSVHKDKGEANEEPPEDEVPWL